MGRPVVGLSPMDGVTDAAMRYMTAKYGGPDIVFTEFVSVDALHHATGERRERLLKTFMRVKDVDKYSSAPVIQYSSESKENRKTEKREYKIRGPYEIAQVFGNIPELFEEAAELVESLGFDGIDINMGCPAHKVEENGSGAGLIRTPQVAQEIIRRVKAATKLPVSVKTRIGVDKIVVEEWMETLMEMKPANISLHGRTLKQLYQGSADWEAIGRAAEVVHKHGGHILGNGDVLSLSDGTDKVSRYGVDGFLIGRAAEGNPRIFLQGSVPCKFCGEQGTEPCIHKRMVWMVEHAKIFEKIFKYSGNPVSQFSSESQENGNTGTLENHKSFMPMRKHLAWYCKGFPGAVEIRSKLMLANSASEVEQIVSGIV